MKGLIIFCFFLTQATCNQPEVASQTKIIAPIVIDTMPAAVEEIPTPAFRLPYQLNLPLEIFKLPKSLAEISGLSVMPNSDELCAIQDEDGDVFCINKKTGKVTQKTKFWKKGDYEGVEMVGEKIYVIKSTGTLYEVQNLGKEDQNVIKYNTFLTRENDVEGLGYNKENNSLLIACKGLPKGEDSYDVAKMKKEIYQFDLATNKMNPQPAYTISQEMVYDFLTRHDMGHDTEKLIEYFQPNRSLTFSPSALAVHPVSKNIYILSSVKKILIVLNQSGEIIHISLLNKKIHRQPEGIAFNDDGTMYLSNEGKDGIAKLYRFGYMPK